LFTAELVNLSPARKYTKAQKLHNKNTDKTIADSIWASSSYFAPAHATLDRHPSHCCACHFDGYHSPDDRSAL